MNVRIIANPIAGGGRGEREAHGLRKALEERGIIAEVFITRKAGDAAAEAARPGADCVVAVGGDGSVNEVANGVAGSSACVAILPLGTANVVARELGAPLDSQELADLIARRSLRTIDAGLCDGRRFLLGAGAGLDAAVVKEVHARRGKRLSYIGYVLPTLRTLRSYSFPPIRVIVDGRTLCEDAHYAIVGNCRYSAGLFPFTPDARIDDGLLDICIFRDLTVLRMAKLAVASWLSRFSERKDVLHAQGHEVTFESTTGQSVPRQTDGDPAGNLPATYTIEPGALRVVAP